MRNQQAARYARWAAWAAGAIALVVAGVFAKHAIQEAQARHNQPQPISSAVEQQSNELSFSKIEQNVTIFTVRAGKSTQFKDENQMVLQDVWITIFGRNGDRNDNIHTSECKYQPKTGSINCQGSVQIDLASKSATGDKVGAKSDAQPGAQPDPKSIQITTSNLSFNRASGEASTAEPVQFRFAQGHGSAVGVSYSTDTSVIRLLQNVQMDLDATEKSGGLPVTITGGNLAIHRNERRVELAAPAVVKQGTRVLTCERITIDLDEAFKARSVRAEGHPALHSADPKGEFGATADRFEASLDAAGWIEKLAADGNVVGTQHSGAGTDRFSTSQAVFAMEPQSNMVKTMNATGGVVARSEDATGSRTMKTDALLVHFGASGNAIEHSRTANSLASSVGGGRAGRRQVTSAETLAPATIEMKNGNESTSLKAKQFVTRFSADGKLDQLLGHSGVEITRQIGNAVPQLTSSNELAATFDKSGQWSTLEQNGSVHFQQSDRQATAARAHIVRVTNVINLEGSPVLSDASSRTTAGNVTINQASGEIQATKGVVSTYLSGSPTGAMNLGSGPGHVSADTLTGSSASGHAVYAGHARLWQGESVLDANQIELWRDEKKMQASGGVVAVFRQASAPGVAAFGKPPIGNASPVAKDAQPPGPTLWHIRAPLLTYWSDQGKAHLETGVQAQSQQGSMDSQTLDVFLAPAAPGVPGRPEAAPAPGAGGSRQLDRALAQGGVVVRQGDRRATAEQALYVASDGKFILSGGQPTIVDASSDTTTGHSLTFFVANDTILIDSQEGSRTLTKHRVEK